MPALPGTATIFRVNTSHYFSPEQQGPIRRRTLTVNLEGKTAPVTTAAGIFSPDGVDKGSAVLLKHVPDPAETGELLDIGCGWGPLTLTMALRSPAARIWAVDVNPTARTLCAENAQAWGLENVTVCAPEEVPDEIRFSTIWSNPPIRVGKQVLHEILRTWLPRLTPDGQAWLVVQKNLGADSLQRWMQTMLEATQAPRTVDRANTEKSFRVFQVAAA